MRVVLIGAGSLACSLGHALACHGHQVVQVYSRTERSASYLASKLNCAYTDCLHSLVGDADIYFACLLDEALVNLAGEFTRGHEQSLFVHVSGSVTMDVLPTRRRGVMWPVHSFSRNAVVTDWKDIPLFIESSDLDDLNLMRYVARTLSANVYEADGEARRRVHLAAEFCNNFSNHCYSIAETLLHGCGLPFSSMRHIISSTTDTVASVSPHDAQSGPARRHDKAVMDSDRELLKDSPDLLEIYNVLSSHIEKEYD